MAALIVVFIFVVLLLGILVAGLLRSHADILKALHDLGAGVGDPANSEDGAHERLHGAGSGARVRVPFTMGLALPGERNSASAPTLAGVTPNGDALAITVTGHDTVTLICFLSSGCSTSAGFWEALPQKEKVGLPDGIRLVVVTKGPELELPAEVRARAHPDIPVVMSTEAWGDYEVPGSPFFVLVDGNEGRRIGEGVANHFSQVAELVRRAAGDVLPFGIGSQSKTFADGLGGPARESANDAELLAAGINPGHRSLYPRSLADVFPAGPVRPSPHSPREHDVEDPAEQAG